MALPPAIGPYRIVRELGRGGMGVVYEAEDPALGRRVAVKQVLAGLADPEALLRFEREAAALAKLRHSGVVGVHACGAGPQGPYLVTELIPGEPLDALLARGPLPPERAVELLVELAGAVAALHAAGLLHRDLKPSNVIVRPSGSPVLLDFGLVRELDAATLTQSGDLLGTPAYMAPEQARGVSPRELDARVDVYGLGAVLYACLAGHAPHTGAGAVATILSVLEREPPAPPDAPAALREVLRRALAKDPARRYPDAAALEAALTGFLRGEPAPPRRGRLAVAAAAAGAAAIALAAWAFAPRPPDAGAGSPAPGEGGGEGGVASVGSEAPASTDHAARVGRPRLSNKRTLLSRWDKREAVIEFVDEERLLVLTRVPQPALALWDVEREESLWKKPLEITGDQARQVDVVRAAGREWAVVTAADRRLWRFDLASHGAMQATYVFELGLRAVAVSPDGRQVAISSAVGGYVSLRETSGWTEVGGLVLGLPKGQTVTALAFDAAGERLAAVTGYTGEHAQQDDLSPQQQGSWHVWRLGESEPSLVTERERMPNNPKVRLPGSRSVCWVPGGAALLVGTLATTIQRWPLPDGPSALLEGPGGREGLRGSVHTDGVLALVCTPSGLLFSAAGGAVAGELRAWDARTGRSLGAALVNGGVRSVSVSPGETRLAVAGVDGRVEVYDLASGPAAAPVAEEAPPVWRVVPKRRTLVSATGGARARPVFSGETLWVASDALTLFAGEGPGRALGLAAEPGPIAPAPGGGLWVAEERAEGAVLRVEPDGSTGAGVVYLPDGLTASALAASPTGDRLYCGVADGGLVVAAFSPDWVRPRLRRIPAAIPQGETVTLLAVSPDGRRVAAAADATNMGRVALFDREGARVGEPASLDFAPEGLAFAADGALWVATHGARILRYDGVDLRRLGAVDGEAEPPPFAADQQTPLAHAGALAGLAAAPAGLVVSVSREGRSSSGRTSRPVPPELRVWDARTRRLLVTHALPPRVEPRSIALRQQVGAGRAQVAVGYKGGGVDLLLLEQVDRR